MNRTYLNTVIGILKIEGNEDFITSVEFVDSYGELNENEIVVEAKKQLQEYFQGNRKVFTVKTKPMFGTEFQQKVWNALKDIPYGQTVSYKYIAEKIGNPKGGRAVGGANNKNPIAIIVPCHRVIGSNGKLVGYAGGLHIKEYILKLEKELF